MIPVTPVSLLLAQIIAHLSLIAMIIYGTWWQWAISVGVYFLTGCFGMTMTYHRYWTHKAWQCPEWLAKLFTIFATLGMTGSAISWVAVHREHHAHTDTEKDPHGPRFRGFLWVHFLSMFAPVRIRMVPDLLRNTFLQWQHKHYFTINLVYAAILYAIDPFAVVYAWLVPAMFLWNAGSSINSISHFTGKAENYWPLVVLMWGEGYHANHHTLASAKRFGKYDIGGVLIELIEKMGVKK